MKAGSAKWTYAAALVLLVASRAWAAEDGAEGGSAPYLISSTVWAIVSFVVVLFILSKKLFPPILAAMDKRAQDIRESLEAAERAKAEAEEMMKRHQDDLAKARDEASAIIEEGRADALRLKESIVSSARKDSEDLAARAKRDIELTKHNAIDELQKLSARLAVDIANELIRKNLTVEDQQKLIEERIKQFPAA